MSNKKITLAELASLEPSPLYMNTNGELCEQNELDRIPAELSERARYRADADAVNGLIRYYTGQTREEFRELMNQLAIEWLTNEFSYAADPEAEAYKALCFLEVRGWWQLHWNERNRLLVKSCLDAFEFALKSAHGDIISIRQRVLFFFAGYHRSWLYEDNSYGEQLRISYSKLW